MEVNKMLEMVASFMKACDQEVNNKPCNVDDATTSLRYHLLSEENREYMVAAIQDNKVEILDALVDIAYVLFGTINAHGMQKEFVDGFRIVHENNMTKVQENGKVLKDASGKVLKPQGYKKVDLSNLIK
jgi:predicted HAD superfamily Cof-like phosphohydrolase